VAARVRAERKARLKPTEKVARARPPRTTAPRPASDRWRPLQHELEERLSQDYQQAVARKAREFRIEPFTLIMDNSLRRIPANGYVRKSRNRPLISRGLATGDPSAPRITALGRRLITELDRELSPAAYPPDALV
jgi:hypothetical protein